MSAENEGPFASVEDLFESITHAAKSTFETFQEVRQTFFIVAGNGRRLAVLADWSSDEEKAMTLEGIRHFMKMTEATQYGFIAESWFAKASDDPNVSKLRLRDREDRSEAVTILAVTKEKSLFGSLPIERDEKGARLGVIEGPHAVLNEPAPEGASFTAGAVGHLLEG